MRHSISIAISIVTIAMIGCGKQDDSKNIDGSCSQLFVNDYNEITTPTRNLLNKIQAEEISVTEYCELSKDIQANIADFESKHAGVSCEALVDGASQTVDANEVTKLKTSLQETDEEVCESE
ncbi:MAG: hypothetical protein HRU19_25745 [Pseudobacteriovorax sp.]|nr:hypothetical protein [Pseudobacteriovorax sp.]